MKHAKNRPRLEKNQHVAEPRIRGKLTGSGSNRDMALEKELKYFNENHEKWKKTYMGKIALVKGDSLIDVFDSANTAFDEGVKRFGTDNFLIRQIGLADSDVQIPALTLGLINARLA